MKYIFTQENRKIKLSRPKDNQNIENSYSSDLM